MCPAAGIVYSYNKKEIYDVNNDLIAILKRVIQEILLLLMHLVK